MTAAPFLSVYEPALEHDADVCGINTPGYPPACPACRQADATLGAVGRELGQILERFDAADKQLHGAQMTGDRAGADDAELRRWEARGQSEAAAEQLADLGVTLFRYACKYRPQALRVHIRELLREDFDALARGILDLEARRK